MLAIMHGVAGAQLSGGQPIGITARADRQRLRAEHRAKLEAAWPDPAHRMSHQPVDAAGLAAGMVFRTDLVEVLHEQLAVQHQLPASDDAVDAVHRAY